MELTDKQIYDRNRYKNNRDKLLRQCKDYKAANPEVVKERVRKWQMDNKDKCAKYSLTWRKNNLEKYMLSSAKTRAKEFGLEFDITIEDVQIPDVCPILGIKFAYPWEENYKHAFAPSLDRIDNSKGYVKGNVRVISDKANNCKKDLTQTEIENLLKYIKGEI